jgi:hypothetical protein
MPKGPADCTATALTAVDRRVQWCRGACPGHCWCRQALIFGKRSAVGFISRLHVVWYVDLRAAVVYGPLRECVEVTSVQIAVPSHVQPQLSYASTYHLQFMHA